jgi:hypothetical protein
MANHFHLTEAERGRISGCMAESTRVKIDRIIIIALALVAVFIVALMRISQTGLWTPKDNSFWRTYDVNLGGDTQFQITILKSDDNTVSGDSTDHNSDDGKLPEYSVTGLVVKNQIQLNVFDGITSTNLDKTLPPARTIILTGTMDGKNMSGTATIQTEGKPDQSGILWSAKQVW